MRMRCLVMRSRLEHAVLAGLGQRDRHALAARAADAADAVHVGLGRRRHVVVDDVGQVVDVEAAAATSVATSRSAVPLRSPAHDPVALLLAHAAVQRLGAIAAAVERLGQLVDFVRVRQNTMAAVGASTSRIRPRAAVL